MEKFLNNNNEEISETALPLSQSYQATDLFAYSPPSITSWCRYRVDVGVPVNGAFRGPMTVNSYAWTYAGRGIQGGSMLTPMPEPEERKRRTCVCVKR